VDNTVIASNIDGEIRELSEGLLSDNRVVDEILTEFTGKGEGFSCDGGEIERSTGQFVRLDSKVSGCKDSEGSGSSKGSSNTRFIKTLDEESEVVVSTKVTLLESLSDSISSPYLSRSLESSKSVNN